MTLHKNSNLTEQQLVENYNYFINVIDTGFSGERRERLLAMYRDEQVATELTFAPASGTLHFHNAHAGGYIQHVLNAEKAVRGVQKHFELMGGTIDYTDEERLFAILHHDLGKIGDHTGGNFIPQTNDWAKRTRKEVFVVNPEIQAWRVTDRALFVLQYWGVKVTWKETLGIKLSDGMYDEDNAYYLKRFGESLGLKTNLPYVIHWGDHMACRSEHDIREREMKDGTPGLSN